MYRKKVLALGMMICLFVSCPLFANAKEAVPLETRKELGGLGPWVEAGELVVIGEEEPITTIDWAYINSTATTLSISSSGVATSYARVTGIAGTTTKVTVTMHLEKKGLLGLSWSNVASWTQTFNSHTGTLSKTCSVSGGTYRVRAVYTAFRGTATETVTAFSSEVKR